MQGVDFTQSRQLKAARSNSTRFTQSEHLLNRAVQTQTDSASALALLNRHAYVVCISDRIDLNLQYPFEGRENLLDEVLHSITHGDSVLLVGEPGIGKRTISLGLARRLNALRRSHPRDPLFSRDVYTLSLGSSFWNGAQNEDITDIQDNICRVFRLVEEAGPEKIVFCIDDIDVLSFVDRLVKETRGDVSSTGELARDMTDSAISTENMLRFLLFSKKVLCLCTSIKDAYQRLQRSDTYYDEKFTESFRILHMPEATFPHSKEIVFAHRKRLEAEHVVTILDESLDAAVIYGKTYITHRVLPQSALDLLHEACQLANEVNHSLRADVEQGEVGGLLVECGQVRVVVHRHFVDRLIQEWCGVSQAQLDHCFQKHGGLIT